jgi:hypothetical protein
LPPESSDKEDEDEVDEMEEEEVDELEEEDDDELEEEEVDKPVVLPKSGSVWFLGKICER